MKKFLIFLIILGTCVAIYGFFFKDQINQAYIENSAPDYFESQEGIIVLNYHTILPEGTKASESDDYYQYDVSVVDFESHLQYFQENNIDVIDLDELNKQIKSNNITGKSVVITFDDIDQTVYELAYPLLKEYNYPFVLFVVTSATGTSHDEREYATWEQIKEMNESGLATIGLHTDNLHYKENGNAVFLNSGTEELFATDLAHSIDVYKEQIGQKPKYFAYPYGYGRAETDQALFDQEIELIFSLKDGIVTNETEAFFIPRVVINEHSDEYIKAWLAGRLIN